MKWLKDLFSERGGTSMMRVMGFMSCSAAIVVAILGINKPQPDYSGISLLVSAFLTAAMGGKIMQKRIEVDGATSDSQVEK